MATAATRELRSANDEFQLLEALLTNRRKRRQQGVFLVHGVRSIDSAVENGWPLRSLLLKESATSRWAREVAARARAQEVLLVADPLVDRLSQREEGAEVIAVAETRDRELGSLAPRRGPAVVAEGVQSPGNLGMILRSAQALGAESVVITGHAADPYDPQCVRASTGAVFSVPFAHAGSVKDVIGTMAVRAVGLHPDGEVIDGVDLATPLLLIAGTESTGLSRTALELCDDLASIPMTASTASLNVGTAVSIALAEIGRRSRTSAPE